MECVENTPRGLRLEMVLVPKGSFMMGAPAEECREGIDGNIDAKGEEEQPQHLVKVPAFLMGKFCITQAQWRLVAELPQATKAIVPEQSYHHWWEGDDLPVESMWWDDAVEFCDRLSAATGREYRLPSEAEWEYACRAGTTTPYYFGETITTDQANFNGRCAPNGYQEGVCRDQTTNVGSFPPNAFGLHDMHGNIAQWCLDHWHDDYRGAPSDGSAWIEEGIVPDEYGDYAYGRVIRGCNYDDGFGAVRSAYRECESQNAELSHTTVMVGLRVVCSSDVGWGEKT